MKTIALAVIAAVSLTPAAAFAQAATAAPAAAKFGLDTPIAEIAANEKAKAALDAAVPGLTTHDSYEMFKGMSLNQLKAYAGEQLTPEVLAKAETALAAVK